MPSQEPIHLFGYGTLTDPERVIALTGRQFERLDATLSGFERVDSPLGYPFIFPRPGTSVRGILLFNLDLVSLAHLDAYEAEGDLYRRQLVAVQVGHGRVAAMTYVGHGIRASVASMSARWTATSQPEVPSVARASARRRPTPFVDEH